MGRASSFATLVLKDKCKCPNIPENWNFNVHRCVNLKYRLFYDFLFLMLYLPLLFISYTNAVKAVQHTVFNVDPLHSVKSFLIDTLVYAGQR